MNALFNTMLEYWPLAIGFLALIALLWWMRHKRETLLGYREVSPAEAVGIINHDDAMVIDTRNITAFQRRHIPNAINHPAERLLNAMEALENERSRHLILYCQHGVDSARAAAFLSGQGFEHIYKLRGGLTAWDSAQLPTRKTDTPEAR